MFKYDIKFICPTETCTVKVGASTIFRAIRCALDAIEQGRESLPNPDQLLQIEIEQVS